MLLHVYRATLPAKDLRVKDTDLKRPPVPHSMVLPNQRVVLVEELVRWIDGRNPTTGALQELRRQLTESQPCDHLTLGRA